MGEDKVLVAGKSGKAAFAVVCSASLLLVAAFFLPFTTATGEYRETLSAIPTEMCVEAIGLTSEEAADVSLMGYCKAYASMGEGNVPGGATIYLVLFGTVGACSALTFLLALLRKPIGAAFFSLLTLGAVSLTAWDFEERAIVGTGNYNWAVARWLYVAAVIVLVVGAVWAVVEKRRMKRSAAASAE